MALHFLIKSCLKPRSAAGNYRSTPSTQAVVSRQTDAHDVVRADMKSPKAYMRTPLVFSSRARDQLKLGPSLILPDWLCFCITLTAQARRFVLRRDILEGHQLLNLCSWRAAG